jgi:hypothetical protein
MNTTLKLETPKLLQDLDALRLERLPLPLHFANCGDEHSRETYATLLAALLLANGAVSDNQSRLFKLLLSSLQLGQIQARLFEQAQALNQDKLREFFRVIDSHQLAASFFLDALVLCRLDQPLVEAQHQILSELVDLLYLAEQDLPILANLAALVLGLACDADFASDFDFRLATERGALLPYKTDVIHPLDYRRYCVWGEFLYPTLSVEQLKKGVPAGRWLVTEPLQISNGWTLNNVTLCFTETGSLQTTGSGVVKISGCHFEKPLMQFEGDLSCSITESTIRGIYSKQEPVTALSFQTVTKVHLSQVAISTRHARAILSKDTMLAIDDCQFTECGNEKINGGAIASQYTLPRENKVSPLLINGSQFSHCIARIGGAIRVDELGKANMITNTAFMHCTAVAYQDEKYPDFGGGAIFTDSSTGFEFFAGCSFEESSLYFGRGTDWSFGRSQNYIVGSSHLGSLLRNKTKGYFDQCYFWFRQDDSNIRYENAGKSRLSWWNEY